MLSFGFRNGVGEGIEVFCNNPIQQAVLMECSATDRAVAIVRWFRKGGHSRGTREIGISVHW